MIQLNARLILPSSRELDAPYTFPMAAHYTKNDFALCFIAGRHDYYIGSPTHRLIDREFDMFKPQAVVLEGYTHAVEPAWNDEIKYHFINRALAKRAQNPTEQNEARYALLKAYESNIAIYSGEMSDQKQQEIIERSGYTAFDYAGWLFLTRLSCEANITCLTATDMPILWQKLSPNLQLDFGQFNDWHRDFMGHEFDSSLIKANEPRPSYAIPSGKWQALDDLHSKLRNQSALAAIETALNTHHRVFVVYGGSHYGCLRPALDAVLGQPVITR